MKKLAVIFGIALFVLGGCEEGSIADRYPVPGVQYFAPGDEEPYNGERTFDDLFSRFRQKAEYVNGYPVHIVTYYRSGEKRHERFYDKHDMLSITAWYKSGQKKYQAKGKVMREWYENGQLKAEAHYADQRQTLHGITQTWYEDGTLKGQESYSHGELDGKRVKWDAEGNKVLTQLFDEGELVES
jgi:antitoxin component YwqK of YwqJK toxin-antitoxin module